MAFPTRRRPIDSGGLHRSWGHAEAWPNNHSNSDSKTHDNTETCSDSHAYSNPCTEPDTTTAAKAGTLDRSWNQL